MNEFEVVSSKDGNEDATDDMTETQIQEMLDAEDGRSSNDSLTKKWKRLRSLVYVWFRKCLILLYVRRKTLIKSISDRLYWLAEF